jgi:hypothetical protein
MARRPYRSRSHGTIGEQDRCNPSRYGVRLSFSGTVPTAMYHLLVTLIITLTRPFSDNFVLRYEEIRIGFQCFNICRQGAPCNRQYGQFSCCPFCTLWLFQFEESLRNADDPQNLHQQSIAQTTVVYYCSRMEVVSLMSRQTYRVQL